jgi:CheY-like chemotaxis protein
MDREMIINKVKVAGITTAAIYSAAYALKTATTDLSNFTPAEFGVWWPLMDSDLLQKVDQFRDNLQAPVIISPAAGSLGRISGKTKESQHYPQPFVMAMDVMLPESTLQAGYEAARRVGFHGIGVYPDWKPHHGMHLDMRKNRTAESPALWSGLKTASGQQYAGIEQAGVIA